MIDAKGRLPMIQGTPLITLLSNYEGILSMLEDVCKELEDADMGKIVTFGHENEKSATIRWGIWHIADHSRYHQAQINQLRTWYRENNTIYI
ncbi:hypothetical protein D3C77_441700 [compost metagenome]